MTEYEKERVVAEYNGGWMLFYQVDVNTKRPWFPAWDEGRPIIFDFESDAQCFIDEFFTGSEMFG